MGSLNRILLLGEIESTPDIKATSSGDSVANFTLCVERPPRQDGLQSQADHIKIVCWRQLADQVSSYAVGSTLLIEGQIHNRNYDDENGIRHYVTEIEAQDISIVSSIQTPPNPTVKSEPTVESISAPTEPFDFSNSNAKVTLEVPPEFGEKVEEDIPF